MPFPARPPRCRIHLVLGGRLAARGLCRHTCSGVAHGGLRAAVGGPFRLPCAPGPPPSPLPPLPGLLRPGHPQRPPLTPSSPRAASSLLPSLLQLLYRLIRIRHHCFSHLLVSWSAAPWKRNWACWQPAWTLLFTAVSPARGGWAQDVAQGGLLRAHVTPRDYRRHSPPAGGGFRLQAAPGKRLTGKGHHPGQPGTQSWESWSLAVPVCLAFLALPPTPESTG